MKNSLVIILSACYTHQCLAFAVSAFRVSPVGNDDVLSHASSARRACSNTPGGRHRHRSHQRPRPTVCEAAKEVGGVVEGGDGAGDGNDGDGAGAGMGLDGEWQVKSGQGRKVRAGEGVGAVPGQLPEKTRDGQDWAEWAREWREDPQGKADRLVGQWEAEAKETGGSQGSGKSKKRSSRKKKKKKGSGGSSRGVVGSGFGGPARPTKSVPKGLVVAETGEGTGDVVDWSTGQQLAESDRRENMAADWQQDAKHLESLDPSDREKLAEKLRMALGKKPQKAKTKKKAPSGDGRGFSGDPATGGGGGGKRSKGEVGGGGDGRGVLASAAAAAGAVVADDVAGVSVFPTAPAEPPGAVAAGQSGGGLLAPDGVAPVEGETKGGGNIVSGGGDSSVGDGLEAEASTNGAQIPAGAATAVGEGETTPRNGGIASPRDGTSRTGEGVPLERVMGFGKGVAVVEPSSSSSSDDPPRDESVVASERLAGNSARKSVDGDKLSNVRGFGRGVAMPTDEVGVEDEVKEASVVAEKGKSEAAADDARLSGFGRGVALPAEGDER